MNSADDYIRSVTHCLPPAGPMRARIEMELRVIIAEQLEGGRSQDEVLQKLGDPRTLAESYLHSAPLVAAPLRRRIAAKLADIAMLVLSIVPALVLAGRALPSELAPLAVVAGLIGGFMAYGIGTIATEYWWGQTPGKRWFGLHVVRESGAAIGFGQSVVRQLPMVLQIYWLDGLFALFTEKQQRAFELLSKTRVVLSEPPRAGSDRD